MRRDRTNVVMWLCAVAFMAVGPISAGKPPHIDPKKTTDIVEKNQQQPDLVRKAPPQKSEHSEKSAAERQDAIQSRSDDAPVNKQTPLKKPEVKLPPNYKTRLPYLPKPQLKKDLPYILECDWPHLKAETMELWLKLYQRPIPGERLYVELAPKDIQTLLYDAHDPIRELFIEARKNRGRNIILHGSVYEHCRRFLDLNLVGTAVQIEEEEEIARRFQDLGQQFTEMWGYIKDERSQDLVLAFWKHLQLRANYFHGLGLLRAADVTALRNLFERTRGNKQLTAEQMENAEAISSGFRAIEVADNQKTVGLFTLFPDETNLEIVPHSNIQCRKTAKGYWIIEDENLQRFVENPAAIFQDVRGVLLDEDYETSGFAILRNAPDGFFDTCGFEKGDVIVGFNDFTFTDLTSMRSAVNALSKQSKYSFKLVRNGQRIEVRVKKSTKGIPGRSTRSLKDLTRSVEPGPITPPVPQKIAPNK